MNTGLFPIRAGKGGPRPGYLPANRKIAAQGRNTDDRVAEIMADGLTQEQIAEALDMSVSGVGKSVARIKRGLGWQAA